MTTSLPEPPFPLPNAAQAQVSEAKILGYLLNPESKQGAAKARFFVACGFSLTEWRLFADALKRHAHANPVARTAQDPPYGPRFAVDGPLLCPDGRYRNVRTVWIIDDESVSPRLVSAYPL
jgi:hypothetical protein